MLYNITVINWDKYQDTRTHKYFRLYNDFFIDTKIVRLNVQTKALFVFILSQCSRSMSKVCSLDVRSCSFIVGVRTKTVITSIKDLTDQGLILSCEYENGTREEKRRGKKRRGEDAYGIAEGTKKQEKAASPAANLRGVLFYSAFQIYSKEYEKRYGVAAVKSNRAMGLIKNLFARIDESEVELLISFYLSHNDNFYTRKCHPLSLLLMDCEKLRTEMLSGKKAIVENKAEAVSSRAKEMIKDVLDGKL